MVPAVAVYLISCPPILMACLVCTIFSSGFFSSFFSSFLSSFFSPALSDFSVSVFSADLSPGFCACTAVGCIAHHTSTAHIHANFRIFGPLILSLEFVRVPHPMQVFPQRQFLCVHRSLITAQFCQISWSETF